MLFILKPELFHVCMQMYGIAVMHVLHVHVGFLQVVFFCVSVESPGRMRKTYKIIEIRGISVW